MSLPVISAVAARNPIWPMRGCLTICQPKKTPINPLCGLRWVNTAAESYAAKRLIKRNRKASIDLAERRSAFVNNYYAPTVCVCGLFTCTPQRQTTWKYIFRALFTDSISCQYAHQDAAIMCLPSSGIQLDYLRFRVWLLVVVCI